jgi:hypothetical protein
MRQHALVLAIVLGACGGETPSEDAGPRTMDAGGDEWDPGPTISCEDRADGTECVMGICIAEECVESTCGDGFADVAGGEDCDDGNGTASDGCEPGTCLFTCEGDARCDDGFVCNGAERCADHRCALGTPASDGTPCTAEGVPAGVCHPLPVPVCLPAECGNSMRDTREDCDDGRNGDPADGCSDDCQFRCRSSAAGCVLAVIPDLHDYGSVVESTTSEFTFTVQNLGAGTTTEIPTVMLVGADAGQFEIVANTCTLFVTTSDPCTITVRFVPSGAGARRAMLVVTAGDNFAGAAELRGFALGQAGTACTADGECRAGTFCVDSVCCNSSADECGGCYACNVEGFAGDCTEVPAGEDPHGECADPCEDQCDGDGECAPAAEGTVCETEPCTLGFGGNRQWTISRSGIHTCDGTTFTCPETSEYCPGGATCDRASGTCRTTCAGDLDCQLGFYCNAGTCTLGGGRTRPCTRDEQCQFDLVCEGGQCQQCGSSRDCANNPSESWYRQYCNAGSCDFCGDASRCGGYGSLCYNGQMCLGCGSNDDCDLDVAPHCRSMYIFGNGPYNACTCGTSEQPCRPTQTCVGTPETGLCKTLTGFLCNTPDECASGSCVNNFCT